MIKNFLILSCIGKEDKIGLRINEKFYIHNFDKKIDIDLLSLNILNMIKKHKTNIDNNFSIIVNKTGKLSSLRAVSLCKGIKISKKLIYMDLKHRSWSLSSLILSF